MMGAECSECERDLRAGHDPSCSRYKPSILDEMYQAMEDAERDFKRPLKWEMSAEAFMDLRLEADRSRYGTVLLERPQAPEAFGLHIEFHHDMSGWKLKTERQ